MMLTSALSFSHNSSLHRLPSLRFRIAVFSLFIAALLIPSILNAESSNPASLPLVQMDVLEYQGAFIIPSAVYGESSADDVAGQMEYNPVRHSLFFAGKFTQGAVAEFSIPDLVNTTTVSLLNTATVLQDFRRVLHQTTDGNPQSIDRVTGLKLLNGKLIVNGVGFYDAAADNTHTTLVIEDANNIATSTISGYYELQGAAHIAGWISNVPLIWQSNLGGAYLSGNAPNYSINSRYPQGITAFIFDPATLSGAPAGEIPTTTLLDSSLANPLYADFNTYQNANYNILSTNGTSPFTGHTAADIGAVAGNNNLWTESSRVGYGFIVPNSRTYMTIGSSGGHGSGIGYKATPNGLAPFSCPGPCAYDPDDYYNYYWLWDVNDLIAVKDGTMQPYDVRPYAYGVFDAPFQTDIFNGGVARHNAVIGGVYDPASNLLYLTIKGGESTPRYGVTSLVVAYKLTNVSQQLIFEDGLEAN